MEYEKNQTTSMTIILSSLITIFLLMSNISAKDKLLPSFDPPDGLSADSVPLFIVLGFDDNRYLDGMQWTLDLLKDFKNPVGTNNPRTFDNTSIKATFYHISDILDDDEGGKMKALWKTAKDRGHEVADHTVTHNTSKSLTLDQWKSEIGDCRTALATALSINESEIVGFRTPYLDFNEATFTAVSELGMLYECTMTQMQDYNKSQFVWPYTLDEGFADKTITGWVGKAKLPGLWEIPVYTVGENALMWPPITGFDSSILTQANGNKYELMLKNAVDYRLKDGGNRAPITVGLHSDSYAESNPSGVNYDKALTLTQRQAALKNFIKYALTKPMVRFVTAIQLIEWLRNPVPLGMENVAITKPKTQNTLFTYAKLISANNSEININFSHSGNYNFNIYTAKGTPVIKNCSLDIKNGINRISLTGYNLSTGFYILKIVGKKMDFSSKLFL